MCAARPLVAPPDPNSTDHFVYLHGRWEDYERLLAMRGESSVPRITYLRFFALRGERGHERYVELSQSELLPQLAQEMILDRMLDASQSQTAAVRALRQAVRGRAG